MNQSFPQRKSPRLKGYDYSQSGAYFVTICTHQRQYLFGDIQNDAMHRNDLGRIADEELLLLPKRWQTVDIDLYVVMPNHIHAIIVLDTAETDGKNAVPTLGHVVGSYKAGVTRLARRDGLHEGLLWQTRYHDHIIRSEKSLNYIRQYVHHNPARWEEDTFYSETLR